LLYPCHLPFNNIGIVQSSESFNYQDRPMIRLFHFSYSRNLSHVSSCCAIIHVTSLYWSLPFCFGYDHLVWRSDSRKSK
jgi:hypothetical protein